MNIHQLRRDDIPPDDRYRVCRIDGCCGKVRARRLCMRHYNAWYNHGDARAVIKPSRNGVCAVAGCGRKSRSPNSLHCERHYYRQRRNGTTDYVGKLVHPLIEHSQGYVLEWAPDHPLVTSTKRRRVFEHRRVMYDDRGPGPFACHWCGCEVTWKTLEVDHLDNDPKHNEPCNLVPACSLCNRRRGDPDRSKWLAAVGRMIEFNGVTKCLSAWARGIGIKPGNLANRIKAGWPLARALTEPRGKFGPRSQRRAPSD